MSDDSRAPIPAAILAAIKSALGRHPADEVAAANDVHAWLSTVRNSQAARAFREALVRYALIDLTAGQMRALFRRAVENATRRPEVTPEAAAPPAPGPSGRVSRRAAARDDAEFAALYESPEGLYGDEPTLSYHDSWRSDFRRWCVAQNHDFDAWLDRARDAAMASCDPGRRTTLEADWHQGGRRAYFRERKALELASEVVEQLVNKMAGLFEMDLSSPEMLAEPFRTADGAVVPLGQASLAQIEAKNRQHQELIAGNAMAAARYVWLARRLRAAGKDRLCELPEAAA